MTSLVDFFSNKSLKNGHYRKSIAFIRKTSEFYRRNETLFTEIGSHFRNPNVYLLEFALRNPSTGIVYSTEQKGLNFIRNKDEPIHRWTNYLEGFSKDFVYNTIKKFNLTRDHVILDPFAGSGTVNVCAKLRGIPSIGIEINPTISRILKTKTSWDEDPGAIKRAYRQMDFSSKATIDPPTFLETEQQFEPGILENILRIKEQVRKIEDEKIRSYFELAFLTVLLPSSNLKRSPSTGYDKKKTKNLYSELPIGLFKEKVEQITSDLAHVRNKKLSDTYCKVYNADSKEFDISSNHSIDAVITSPPYLNSFDYTQNYKLEIGWMEDVASTKELGELRDKMIVCDNVSRTMMKEYAKKPESVDIDWLDYIIKAIKPRMRERIGIRRTDYPLIVRKYFEDIQQVLEKIHAAMNEGGKVAWVLGDSLIVDVYVPTDLLTMILAKQTGFKLLEINIDRQRRSGVRRSFILRESVLYFEK
ncbi:MAG: DNA methyltransferase [Candidatus Odinarchaeota archaeon]